MTCTTPLDFGLGLCNTLVLQEAFHFNIVQSAGQSENLKKVDAVYDAVSDVVESSGQWRSDFQIGSRVNRKLL